MSLEAVFRGCHLLRMYSVEIRGNGPRSALLLIAHSTDQRMRIIAPRARSRATLGTSTYAIWASDIAYSRPRKTIGTRRTVNSQRPSRLQPIQGSNDAPGVVIALDVEVVLVAVVMSSLSYRRSGEERGWLNRTDREPAAPIQKSVPGSSYGRVPVAWVLRFAIVAIMMGIVCQLIF